MGQRRETAIKVAGGEQAVDQAHRQDQGTVPGERAVRRQGGRNDADIVDRPLSPDSRYGGAKTLPSRVATDLDKIGLDAPLATREDVENFRNTVNVKTDQNSEVTRELAEKSGQFEGKQRMDLSKVPDKIEDGKERTDMSEAWYAKLNPFHDKRK